MPLSVGVNGSWQDSGLNIWLGGERQEVKNAWIGVNGVWRQFITEPPKPPVVSVQPTSLFGYRVGSGTITTTLSTTALDELGTATSYSWRRTAGSPSITPTNATSANTGFSATIGGNENLSGTFVCDVSGPGGTTTSEPVAVNLISYEEPDPFDDSDIQDRLDDLENP